MRFAKACKECRIAKRRCKLRESGPCEQCLRKGVSCSLDLQHKQKFAYIQHSRVQQSNDGDIVSHRVSVELIDIYLDLLHGKPHTLFHPGRLRQYANEAKLGTKLLYSIASLSARFHPTSWVRDKKMQFIELAKASLKASIDDFSLETVQACVLIGHLFAAEADQNLESLFLAVAFRVANIINLPHPRPDDDAITCEEKVRAWWSLYMVDRWSSAGLGVPKQMSDNDMAPYPMPEEEFYTMTLGGTALRMHSHNPGLWAQMVRLARIFDRIQDLHKQQANGRLVRYEVEFVTATLSKDLEDFVRNLPEDQTLNEVNLATHAAKDLGQDFVALHLGFHHYSTLLYFPFLDLQLADSPDQTMYSRKCKQSAVGLSELLILSNRIAGCKAVYFTVAHMTVVSSAALVHELLFGDDGILEETRRRLNSNFHFLVELQRLWPAAVMMTTRLFTFQNMCLRSKDPNTHRADGWMVKFLLQHAFPMDDKPVDAITQNDTVREQHVNDALSLLLS